MRSYILGLIVARGLEWIDGNLSLGKFNSLFSFRCNFANDGDLRVSAFTVRWMFPVYAALHVIPPILLRRKVFMAK